MLCLDRTIRVHSIAADVAFGSTVLLGQETSFLLGSGARRHRISRDSLGCLNLGYLTSAKSWASLPPPNVCGLPLGFPHVRGVAQR
jgi:hypothetical protein